MSLVLREKLMALLVKFWIGCRCAEARHSESDGYFDENELAGMNLQAT
jgi:hypothetical protein